MDEYIEYWDEKCVRDFDHFHGQYLTKKEWKMLRKINALLCEAESESMTEDEFNETRQELLEAGVDILDGALARHLKAVTHKFVDSDSEVIGEFGMSIYYLEG